MARLGWILFFIMTLITMAFAYKFIYSGHTELAPDNRRALILEDFEREFLLTEMRNFLVAVQQITEGIEKKNMQQISIAAKKVGSADLQHVPGSLMGKLPLAMKKMGRSTHKAFDQLAMDAEQLGDEEHTLSQLNQILPTCTACHSQYRVR
ncbi:MAG: hypothetical protein QNL62_00505 [Gammaproteobacteria bacterium]|nr:hypothetical protein [Gammaproteobacteria bacterium]